MKFFIVFLSIFGAGSAYNTSNIQIPGIPSNFLNTPEAKAALCLLPKKFVDFALKLKAQEILQLAMLQPRLQQIAKSGQEPSQQEVQDLIKSSAPSVYKKLGSLSKSFITKAKNLPDGAKQFLRNLKARSDSLKQAKDQIKTNFTILHVFFQELNTNFTSLDDTSRNSLVNFFPTMSHIFGSQNFVDYLKALADCTSFEQVNQVSKTFGDWVKIHACDQQENNSRK